MNESSLFKLYNGGIVGLEEYYYSIPIVEECDDWKDYAVIYVNDFTIELTKFRIIMNISNTYTEPDYTIGDIVLMLNENKDVLNIMCEEVFVELFKNTILNEEKLRDYRIDFEVKVL